MSAGNPTTDAAQRISALADQCVKCGLCLPHCPTYRVAANEAESPRGRIAFAQSLVSGRLEPTPALTAHLDHCLSCVSCERVCPSQVQYGELITTTRGWLRDQRASGSHWLHRLLVKPRWIGVLLHVANLPLLRQSIQSRIALALLRPFGADRLVRELPRLPRVAPCAPVSEAATRGRIGLFLGCVAASVDRDVHAAAVRLLRALGYEVVLPRGQGCCGALALHDGDSAGADALATPTRAAFAETGVDTVLVSASGCFGTLRDRTFAGSAIHVREIHEFLDADARIGALKFRPLPEHVAMHTPCTQRNLARADAAITRLLARIPQMETAVLPAQPGCCGAAGDYFLRYPDIADVLRNETLDRATAAKPNLLVTSNVGCRIFLDNGLRQRGGTIPVIHPIVLLAQQLDNSDHAA